MNLTFEVEQFGANWAESATASNENIHIDDYSRSLCIRLMSESRFPLIAMLLILIANFAIYGIILVPGNTFAGMDFLNLTYPRTLLARDALSHGYVPLWNWYEWGGAPLLATALGAICYPPTWLTMLAPLPYGLQIFVFVHLIGAGLGAWLLARQMLRLYPLPAAYVAIAYAGNAFFMGRIEQSQVIAANALLPWLIWTTWRAVFRRNGERPWIAIIWALTLLAGHPQFAAFNLIATVCLVGFVSIVLPVRAKWHWRRFIGRWWRVLWQVIVGTALAAVQLFPTWELSRLSERIWPYPNPTTPELTWANLPALFIPKFYNLMTGESGRVMGYTELGLYAGALTFPLAVLGLWWSMSHKMATVRAGSCGRKRVVLVIVTLWCLAMVFALGSHAGLGSLVYDYVPFFKQSRGAARILNVAALMLALLAGQGLTWLTESRAIRRLLSTQSKQGVSIRKPAAKIALILCLIAIADLTITHYASLKSILIPQEVLRTRPLMPENIRAELQSGKSRAYRFMAFDSDLYLNNSTAAVSERLARLQPNMNGLSHAGLIDGYEEGLLPLRDRANLFRQYNRNFRGPSPDARLLAAMGVDLMVSEYPIYPRDETWKEVPPVYHRSSIVPTLASSLPPSYQWWQSRYPAARILALDELTSDGLSSEEFLTELQHDFPLHGQIRTPTGQTELKHAFSDVKLEAFSAAKSHFSDVSNFSNFNRLDFTIVSPTSKALLLLPPYPGWKVSEKNLHEIDIKPLNSLSYLVQFRINSTVQHPVHLIFSPFSFRLGLFFSLVAVTILLIIILPALPAILRNIKPWK